MDRPEPGTDPAAAVGLRRPSVLVAIAVACAAGAVALWFVAVQSPGGRSIDAAIADRVHDAVGPSLDDPIKGIALLADALSFAVGAVALVTLAWLRRGPPLAIVMSFVLLGANATTQSLQLALLESRLVDFSDTDLSVISPWPSGHATAAMVLALGAVLIAGPRLRGVTAAAAGVYVLAVGGAMLSMLGHLASDVLAGFLVAAAFVAAGAAVLARPGGERRRERTRSPAVAPALGVLAAAAVLANAVGRAAVTRRDELASALGSVPAPLVAAGIGVLLVAGAAVVWRMRSRGSDPGGDAGG